MILLVRVCVLNSCDQFVQFHLHFRLAAWPGHVSPLLVEGYSSEHSTPLLFSLFILCTFSCGDLDKASPVLLKQLRALQQVPIRVCSSGDSKVRNAVRNSNLSISTFCGQVKRTIIACQFLRGIEWGSFTFHSKIGFCIGSRYQYLKCLFKTTAGPNGQSKVWPQSIGIARSQFHSDL